MGRAVGGVDAGEGPRPDPRHRRQRLQRHPPRRAKGGEAGASPALDEHEVGENTVFWCNEGNFPLSWYLTLSY